MTQYFDTNYRVAELNSAQQFKADFSELLAQVDRAKALNQSLKFVVLGLLTFLYLSRVVDTSSAEAEKNGCTS